MYASYLRTECAHRGPHDRRRTPLTRSTCWARRSLWGVVQRPPEGVTVDVVRAERSDRWEEPDLARLAALTGPRSNSFVLPNAGHWLVRSVRRPAAARRRRVQ